VFHPDTKNKYEEPITIKVNGGPDRLIRCSSKIPKSNIINSHKLLDFEIVAVGLSKRKTITLQNSNTTDAFFQCEDITANGELTISPNQGWIRGSGSQELELVLRPSKKQVYDIPVNMNVPGGKGIRFQVRGRADVPNVTIAEDVINFGGYFVNYLLLTWKLAVYVGATSQERVTFVNQSLIPAVVVLNLKDPDFFLSLPEEKNDNDNLSKVGVTRER
jgi:hypothetical protein